MKSLRSQLLFFWLLLLVTCVGLGGVMWWLYQQSAGQQIAGSTRMAQRSCDDLAARYAASLADPRQAAPQLDLLHVLLQLVLLEAPHVEGGVWSAGGGFLAYAYPTYEGSGVKRDVPEAERSHIAELSRQAARRQERQTDVARASREALVVSACPLQSPAGDLVAWTMTRVPISALEAQGGLRIGLGALLLFVLASTAWLGAILVRGLGELRWLEARVDRGLDESAEPFPSTGFAELDRVVAALNRSQQRVAETREQLRAAERGHARDQRLTALGRMTGGIAHEIRNPIAAMRLKAENALAASPGAQAPALETIVGQIDRLDGLVQRLLATVQPLQLEKQPLAVLPWLQERLAVFAGRAAERGLQLDLDAATIDAGRTWLADPVHLGRAVDNLLDNALRHAAHTVRVSLADDAGHARLTVRDDGPGVPPDLRDQLFEPFATGRRDGTGLGLALAREVALAHDGDLRCVDGASGATFELDLPWHAS